MDPFTKNFPKTSNTLLLDLSNVSKPIFRCQKQLTTSRIVSTGGSFWVVFVCVRLLSVGRTLPEKWRQGKYDTTEDNLWIELFVPFLIFLMSSNIWYLNITDINFYYISLKITFVTNKDFWFLDCLITCGVVKIFAHFNRW